MRKSNWTPSIVPRGDDQNIYLVVDDLGQPGRVWREADVEHTDLETVIFDLLEGQYKNPVRVVCFNTAEQWSQDVSADVAQEMRRRCDLQLRDVPFFLEDFVDRYEGTVRARARTSVADRVRDCSSATASCQRRSIDRPASLGVSDRPSLK